MKNNENTLPVPFVSILAQLIRSPAVVGAEHSFFRVLHRELEERGADVSWYEGVLVAQGAEPDSLMLSAHVDRHGLVCTGPNEFQYAAFVTGSRSDLLGNSVSEQMMHKVIDRFVEARVFAYEPASGAYRGRGVVNHTYVCPSRNNVIFEIEGLEHLVAGTPVAFADRLRVEQDALVAQMDNVLTAAAMVYLFERGFSGTVFFTAGEEAGKSWRYLLEWFRRFGSGTDQLVVVDTSPFPDLKTAAEQQLVLCHKDANASFSENLTARLDALCRHHGYGVLYKDSYVEAQNVVATARGEKSGSLGSTEMGRVIAASDGMVDGTTLQIPTSGYHTINEAAPIASVQAFVHVLSDLAKLT